MAREVMVPVEEEGPGSKSSGVLSFLKELPVLIVLALGIALLIKAFLVQAFFIPSGSMEPTLQERDRVLVNKLTYRFREPSRGELIVFRDPFGDPCAEREGYILPEDCEKGPAGRAWEWFSELFGLPHPDGITKDYIKRIVALPGETIEMRDGEVWVCSEPNCVPLNEDGTPRDGEHIDFPSGPEKGPQKDNYTMPPFRLGDADYFVLGDNRNNSSDSRVFRSISRDSIVGKAFVLLWPPTRFSSL